MSTLSFVRSLTSGSGYRIALVLLLTGFVLLDISLLQRKSMMVDDAIHMPSGYSYLETHDFRLNQEHPPLLKLVSALGLEHVKPELPLDSAGWKQAEDAGDPDDGTSLFCEDFFHRNADKFEEILFWGRLPVVVFPLLLAVAVWAFSRVLFGDGTALLAAFLFLTEPTVIGNATIVQDDLASALAVFLFVLAIRWYLQQAGSSRAVLLGLAIAFALLIKHSLVIVVPITIVLLLAHAVWRKVRYKDHFCRFLGLGIVALAVGYLIFIAVYGFDVGFIDDDEAVFISEWFYITGDWSDSFQSLLTHIPLLLPKYYLYGMDMVVNDVRNGRPAFIFGQVLDRGVWYYFPVAFVLKTSLPFLIATIAGLCYTAARIVKKKWADGLYLLLPPLLYLAMSMTSHLNIGVRHIMPIFPFFALMGAAAVSAFWNNERLRRWHINKILPAALVCWIAVLAVVTFPNYETYFSPLAGGPSNGWRLLSDSNVETGQEVKTLAEYLRSQGETKVNGLFMGSEFIEHYGIDECDLPCPDDVDSAEADPSETDDQTDDSPDQPDDSAPDEEDKPPNFVAIGAYYFDEIDVTPEQRAAIDRYRDQQPLAMVGNSIFVFKSLDADTDLQQK